MRTES